MPLEPADALSNADVQITHHDKHVYIVTPPHELLEMSNQQDAVKAFFKAVSDAAAKHREEHGEGAVMVLDMAHTRSMNSAAILEMADAAKQMNDNGNKLVLAKTDRMLARMLSKMDREKSPVGIDLPLATVVAKDYSELPPPEMPAPVVAAPAAASITTSEEPTKAPEPPKPPKPEWVVDRIGNAIVINPPEGTKLEGETDAMAFTAKVKEFIPKPEDLAHAEKPQLILNMETVKVTSHGIGPLLGIPKAAKAAELKLTVINIAPDTAEKLRIMHLDTMFNLSKKPLDALITAANTPDGAAAGH